MVYGIHSRQCSSATDGCACHSVLQKLLRLAQIADIESYRGYTETPTMQYSI